MDNINSSINYHMEKQAKVYSSIHYHMEKQASI